MKIKFIVLCQLKTGQYKFRCVSTIARLNIKTRTIYYTCECFRGFIYTFNITNVPLSFTFLKNFSRNASFDALQATIIRTKTKIYVTIFIELYYDFKYDKCFLISIIYKYEMTMYVLYFSHVCEFYINFAT